MQQNDLHQHGQETGDFQEGTKITAVSDGDFEAGEFRAGDVIDGAYEVLKWIGAGGMGNVYCVRHSMMQQEYALKTLSADKVTEVAWRRFQNEAQAIARMQHPGIVAIYNLGLHDGRLPYYVMDLLKGQSLTEMIRIQGPLEVNLALSLFAELCGAFGYAHKKGIVHRDIKPANIVLLDVPEAACRAKIVDFGIAKLSGVKDPKNQFLTTAGEICGSPYYMSPEQTNGERIDARSDIYSLGCTLFEVLTGVPPLRGRSALETMLQHQTTTPPSLKAASGGKEFPEMLESVMATLLAKTPMDRYQTMELVAQDFNIIVAGAQTAINPYASQSPKLHKQLHTADNNGDSNKNGQEPALERQRKYGSGGSEAGTGQSDKSQTPIVLIGCVLSSIILIAVSVIMWWPSPKKSETTAATAPLADSDLSKIPHDPSGTVDRADAVPDREERNTTGPTKSLKDTTPFSHTEEIDGQPKRVFEFPTDIVIGDLDGEQNNSSGPAFGRNSFTESEKVVFSPDPILLRYPQYLSRFRTGDIDRITLGGRSAGPEMFKHIWQVPGVKKLALINCPQFTETDLGYVDKMPSLCDLTLDSKTAPAATLAHLKRLTQLKNLTFSRQDNCDTFLKLIKDSAGLNYLDLSHSKVSRQGFQYIAQIPDLISLCLDGAAFSPADLPLLDKTKLQSISLKEHRLDWELINSIKRLQRLRQIIVSDDSYQPLSILQIRSQLRHMQITTAGEKSEGLWEDMK